MEAKFTPGPWRVSDTRTISGPNRAIIGKIFSRAPIQRPTETGEGDANARLIASALEMHALLEEVFGVIANAKDLGGAMSTNDAFRARVLQERVDAFADKARALLTRIRA